MKKKPKSENHGILLGTVIIIVVMVIVFGAVFAWMYSMDMLFLPDFIEQLVGFEDDEDELPWDLGALSEIVKNGKSEQGDEITFDITYENLRAALLSKESEPGVFLSAVIKYYDGETPYSRNVTYSRDGDKFRVQLYAIQPQESTDAPVIEALKIADEKSLYIYDYSSDKSTMIPRNESIVPENEAGIPSVDSLLSLISEFPEADVTDSSDEDLTSYDAQSANIKDTVIKLVRSETGNVYYVSFTDTSLDITEEYYVSLDYRMIISATTKQSGKIVYSYETKSFSADPAIYTQASLYNFSESAE